MIVYGGQEEVVHFYKVAYRLAYATLAAERSVPPPCKQCDGEYRCSLSDRHLFCFFSACMIVVLDGGDQQGGVLP